MYGLILKKLSKLVLLATIAFTTFSGFGGKAEAGSIIARYQYGNPNNTGYGVNLNSLSSNAANVYNTGSADSLMRFSPDGSDITNYNNGTGLSASTWQLRVDANRSKCLAPIGLYNNASVKLFDCNQSTRWVKEEAFNAATSIVRFNYLGNSSTVSGWCLNSANINQLNNGRLNVYPCAKNSNGSTNLTGDVEQLWVFK
jgi:hypothetical protein